MNDQTSTAIASPATWLTPPLRASLRRGPFWLLGGVIVLSGVTLALILISLRTQTRRNGERLTESFAQVLAQETSRTLQTVDQRLQLAALQSHGSRPGKPREETGREPLRDQIRGMSFLLWMSVIDADGRAIHSTQSGVVGMSVADRGYFQEQRDHQGSAFQVGPPLRSRATGAWLISATRPLPKEADGRFKGLIAAGVDPAHFEQLWRSVDVGPGGSIALFTRSGTLMVRSPADQEAMGKTFQNLPLLERPLDDRPTGHFLNRSVFDGTLRLFAYQVLPGYPGLVLVVGQSWDFVLAPWRQLAGITISVWGLASLVIIGLGASLNRAERQRSRTEARVQELAERLTLATDAASIGVWDCELAKDLWSATPTYFKILGYEAGNGTGRRQQWLELVHPEDQPAIDQMMDAALTGRGALQQSEVRLRHADGSYRWVKVVGRGLDPDTQGLPTRLLGVAIDITESKQSEEALQRSMEQKEGLLKEIHHRVKNNLQVITSLLRLETSRSNEPATKSVLTDMQGRIRSMALLHETLYRTRRFGRVELSDYLRQLTTQIFRAQSASLESVRLTLDLTPLQVDIGRTIPCGLIVNELVSNSLKHGFPAGGPGGEVVVSLRREANDDAILQVKDTGPGLPADFEVRRAKSLGLHIVGDLARQLGGRFEIGPAPQAIFTVIFPAKSSKENDSDNESAES